MFTAAVPSTGVPPYFEGMAHQQINTIHQFDWNYLNTLNPEFVEETKDFDVLERFIDSMTDAKYGNVDMQFLPFPISRKYFEIVKLSMKHLRKQQFILKKALKQKDDEIEYLKHKLEKTLLTFDNLPPRTSTDVTCVHTCPVCGRFFKAIPYLDKHIKKEHPNLDGAWIALRSNTPYGINREFEEIKENINDLRACVTRQNIAVEKGKIPVVDRTATETKPIRRKKPKVGMPFQDSAGKISGGMAIPPKGGQYEFVSSFLDSQSQISSELYDVSSISNSSLSSSKNSFLKSTSSSSKKSKNKNPSRSSSVIVPSDSGEKGFSGISPISSSASIEFSSEKISD